MRMVSLAMLALAGTATPPPMSGHVTIAKAWFRSLPAHLPAGGYFELRNTGHWPVKLTGARSSGCSMLMLHRTEHRNGMDSMSGISGVDVPSGGSVKFAPGGYHMMCMNPAPVMKPGRTVPVTLNFGDGSVTTARFVVKNAKDE